MLTQKQNSLVGAICIVIVCGCALLVGLFVDWGIIIDRFEGRDFQPTAELSALEHELQLTDRAKIILAATHPTIKSSDAFNDACSSTGSEVYILGCYDSKHIHIFDVSNSDLNGIEQSSLAHELLHAIWDRISIIDQNSITSDFDVIYRENYDALEPRLALYPDDDFYDELHSIIGTEYANLSEKLENHYARFFLDQDRIVDYYLAYDAKFQELKVEAENLFDQIDVSREVIDAKTTNYDDAVNILSADITDFNERATNGYFTSVAAFNAERATLTARQQQLSDLYDEIAELVDATNILIERYNSNIARTQTLLDSINSNAQPILKPDEIAE